MSAVVHHGGAGTTAAGLNAGKPTIIIPHSADQPAWGKRVYELGVGAKPIPKAKLTASKLADAIKEALNPEIVKNAEEFGKKMRKENGVEVATQIISKFLKNK
jgi:sterol 3beta-glucosyltransferase